MITKVPPPDPDPDPGLRADLKSEFCSFSLSFFFCRQHGLDPDAQEQLQQFAEERVPRTCGHLRRRVPHAEQHQHTDRPGLHLRPGREHEAVQRRGADGEGGAEHGSPGGHLTVCRHLTQ